MLFVSTRATRLLVARLVGAYAEPLTFLAIRPAWSGALFAVFA